MRLSLLPCEFFLALHGVQLEAPYLVGVDLTVTRTRQKNLAFDFIVNWSRALVMVFLWLKVAR